jgi:DegV family protein with EDD domain
MEKIALVTDSTADIPDHLAKQNQLHVVPNLIVIDGRSYQDGTELSREEFYRRLPLMKQLPTTGTASSGVYQALYQRIFQSGIEKIISLHASSKLSGIINAATAAAREFGGRVVVQDSEHVSMGLGFQVLAAAEAVARCTPLPDVLALLQDVRRRVRVVAMLDTLEYVRRSGRVSWTRARIGNLLQVKPFIEVRDGGKVVSLGEARTRSKGIARLLEFLKGAGDLERLAVLHTNSENDAIKLLADLSPALSTEPLIINITNVIGTHVGPNALGFAVVVK